MAPGFLSSGDLHVQCTEHHPHKAGSLWPKGLWRAALVIEIHIEVEVHGLWDLSELWNRPRVLCE